MSPELETLDQLIGGDMALPLIRGLFLDDDLFVCGLSGLLHAGELRLLGDDGMELAQWRWREVLAEPETWPAIHVSLTPAGARRINRGQR